MADVLVVEHDTDTREAVVELLTEEGYGAIAVTDSDQAIEYLGANEAPCMLLLDLAVRDEAIDLLRWLRGRDGFRALRIAVTTAWPFDERRLAEFRANISRVVRKPFNLAELLIVVTQHCGVVARA